jgi:hypothetical protein
MFILPFAFRQTADYLRSPSFCSGGIGERFGFGHKVLVLGLGFSKSQGNTSAIWHKPLKKGIFRQRCHLLAREHRMK